MACNQRSRSTRLFILRHIRNRVNILQLLSLLVVIAFTPNIARADDFVCTYPIGVVEMAGLKGVADADSAAGQPEPYASYLAACESMPAGERYHRSTYRVLASRPEGSMCNSGDDLDITYIRYGWCGGEQYVAPGCLHFAKGNLYFRWFMPQGDESSFVLYKGLVDSGSHQCDYIDRGVLR